MLTSTRKTLVAAAAVLLTMLLAKPAFAVWPMPQYSSYPDCSGASPAENCSQQPGDKNLHWQVKLSDRTVQYPGQFSCTPISGQFGGFCDGPGCTSQGGFCRQPSILSAPSYEVVTKGSGTYLRFHVEYDFPGNYCQLSPDGNVAEWPIVFNNYHLNRLQVIDTASGNIIAESMAVFEHGQWNPLIPFCGTGNYILRVLNECQGLKQDAPVTIAAPPTGISPTPCGGDRNCFFCSLSPSGGPGLPGPPADPINTGSGDVTVTVPLFSISQSPLSLSFGLEYHSQLAGNQALINEPMGRGWTHPFNQSLRMIDIFDRDLYRLRADGSEVWYRWLPLQGIWTAERPGEVRETVTLVSGQYRIADLNGNVTAFDAASGFWLSTTDRWGNRISGSYSGALLTALTDAEGRQVQFSYASGALTQIALPDGSLWRFSYANGELAQIFDPIHTASTPWRTFEYQADTRGVPRLLTAMRDETGKLLEGHAYDALERGITSVSENGRKSVTVAYDAANHAVVTSVIDGAATQTATLSLAYQRGRYLPLQVVGNCASCGSSDDTETFQFDGSNYPTQKTDGSGNSSTYVYDGSGNLIRRTEAVGTPRERTTTLAYGYAAWPRFVTQMTETSAAKPGAVKVITNTWNTTGSPETTLTSTVSGYLRSGDSAPTAYTTLSTFDVHHRLLTVDGPRTDLSDVTTHTYYSDSDANLARRGRVQQITDAVGLTAVFDNYDVYGTALLATDANNVQTVLLTDARGRVVSRTVKGVAGDPRESADYIATSTFDGRDRLVRTTMPRGNAMTYAYEDGTNRLTDTIRLDASGNEAERRHLTFNSIGDKIREEDQQCASPATPCTSWATKRQEDFAYDLHNRLAAVLHAVPSGSAVLYSYDGSGRMRSVQDENHAAPNTTYDYDELNRLSAVTQSLGSGTIVTRYAYDVQDNLLSVTDPNGNTTTYAYDDFRRMQTQTSPVTGLTSYTYDEAGNLTATTDANNATTRRTYDAANRVTSSVSTAAGGTAETLTWTYDDATVGNYGKGRVARTTDLTGSMTYAYDRRGLMRSEQHTIEGNAYSILYGFDANGNRSSITYPSGRVVTYTFDFADRALSAASAGTNFVTSANYLPFGPEGQVTFGNGTTKSMTYDLRYRPVENKLTSGLGVLADYQYSEDAVGNITAIRDAVDPTYNRDFGYDDLHRLTRANSGSSLWGAGAYTYDAMGNMLTLSLGAQRQSAFAYAGTLPKLTSVTENGSARPVSYDAAGNEQAVGADTSTYSPRNLLNGASGLTYGYDSRGLRTITTVTSAFGTVSGNVVTAATGAAVAGATVTIDGTVDSTVTDANGNFSLNQPAGNFTLTVVRNGFLPETTTAFTLTAGASLPVGTIKLSVAPSTITGSVVSSLGGSVAGATVALSGTGVTASTNAGGNFSITIAAGTFTANVSAGGYTSQTTPSFTTQPGQTYALGTITLAAIPATVTGTVTSSTGGAVAGATVTASGGPAGASHNGRIKTLAVTTTTTTDGSGNFTLSLAAGTYSLTITKAGFGTANTSQFGIGAGTTFSIGTVIIDPLGTISGQVVAQSTGSPIANATVSLPGNVSSVSTDATGHFSVQQTSGTYSIHVSAIGFADVNTPFFTLAPGASYDAGTIKLPAVALAVYVGYADDLRPSANFPVPWAGTPNVLYIGSSSPIDAGAIRLDNNTDSALPVDSVTVDLGRPGPAFNLWGSFTVPAHGSVILTQTSQFNFDTSDYPIGQCGQPLVAGDPRVPIVAVKSNGITTTYFDTAHILDTGGFDLACRGNESLQWRLIGTTGINANGDFLLSPPTGTGQLGQPYTVTATVTDANGQPLANAAITFKVIQGPSLGTTGSAITNAAGSAVFTYTSHSAGTDTIQASITNASGGISKSNPVTVTWPAFSNLNVFVGYADDLRAGSAFPNPWQGSPNVVYIGSGLPIDAGAIRIDNSSSTPVTIDRVVVDLQRPGPTFNLWGTFTIPAHGSAILTQTTQYNFDTSDYPITGCFGSLSPADTRIPKITVTTAGQSASYLDTSHILDTFGYDLAVCPDPSNESLQWRPVGSTSTASAGHLALRPLSAVNAVGATYTATAVATDAGNEPVAGLLVNFRVVTGPNSGITGHASTDANGLATFTYSSAAAGTDTLRASITNSLGAVLNSNDVTSNWVSTVTLQLAPASTSAAIGSTDNATAFVTDGSGSPLANLIVAFRVTTGPNAGKTGISTTDATGHAVFTYFSTLGGTDTLVASVAGANGSSILSNQVTVTWSAPMSITLAPSSASNAIGANYTATAFVSTAGSPSSGASVTFTVVTGPDSGRTSTTTTDGTGHASFTFTSQTIGVDVVQATTGSVSSNQVIARWIAIPTALTYTGALAGEVNDPLTLSARLTEAGSGNALAGRTVTFTFGAQTLTATTDASGNASVNPAPPAATGAIAATVTFAAAGSYTGSSASLFINIVRDESVIRYTGKTVVADATAQTLTALLTDADGVEPLTGRMVTFTIGSVTATATTDAGGVATANVNIPLSAGTGSIRLVASFAGDVSNVPASTSVPVILYQPQSFVIWGGNAVPPHIGDHVNFWGSQWDRQVTAGDYDNKADFKGWATPVGSALVPCGVTGHADGKCWSSKPGSSSPPASLERYISVIVSTSIVKNGSSIDGNIAAVVVVRVDASPVYGNDPGKAAYGTIVAVITDGARLFSTSTPAAPYSGYFFRHLATPQTQIASLTPLDLASLFSATTTTHLTSVLRPTPLTVAAGTKRYSFYTPEMHLLAETALTSSGAPATAYEYIWFNGHPVAQIDSGSATHWTFTDHLGTPILLTNNDASTYWRAEYEPFGAVYALRSPDVHQPLRLPGQEAEQLNLGGNGVTEREYNIFRWYRSGWGRYTQVDPIDMPGQEYAYGSENPARYSDRLGLFNTGQAAKQVARQAFNGCEKEASSSLAGPIAMAIVALFQAEDANPQEFEDQIKPCKKCCDELNDVVQKAKSKVGGLGGCKAGMSRWALRQRYAAWLDLATARARRDVRCWNGGDAGHQQQQADAWSNVGNCARLLGM